MSTKKVNDNTYVYNSEPQKLEELRNILWTLQRLADPNGLITSDIEWAERQLAQLIIKEKIAEIKGVDKFVDRWVELGWDDELMINAFRKANKDRIKELESQLTSEEK